MGIQLSGISTITDVNITDHSLLPDLAEGNPHPQYFDLESADETQTIDDNVTISGLILVSGLTITAGAAEGKILKTDGTGLGTWEDPPTASGTSNALDSYGATYKATSLTSRALTEDVWLKSTVYQTVGEMSNCSYNQGIQVVLSGIYFVTLHFCSKVDAASETINITVGADDTPSDNLTRFTSTSDVRYTPVTLTTLLDVPAGSTINTFLKCTTNDVSLGIISHGLTAIKIA